LIEGGFVNNPQDSRLIANPEYRQRLAVSILQGVEAYKRSLNPSAPAPSALVSGAQPTSIPDLAPINPTAIPEIPPVPAGSPSPAPEKSTTADPQENSSATASVEPTPEPIKPLPANWHLGYPPGRKKPSAEPEPVESHEE
jgi:hypothetical protein